MATKASMFYILYHAFWSLFLPSTSMNANQYLFEWTQWFKTVHFFYSPSSYVLKLSPPSGCNPYTGLVFVVFYINMLYQLHLARHIRLQHVSVLRHCHDAQHDSSFIIIGRAASHYMSVLTRLFEQSASLSTSPQTPNNLPLVVPKCRSAVAP